VFRGGWFWDIWFEATTSKNSLVTKKINHSLLEDAQAFVLGTALCAVAIEFLRHSGLITGQTAGLGVLISYMTGWSFGAVYFVLNLPFYALAWFRMGARFTIKTFIGILMLSVMTEIVPHVMTLSYVHPVAAALLGGSLIGFGVMSLFRHGASLGGIGILALYLQERFGIQAGWVQLGFDVVLFAVALLVLELDIVAYSLLGAIATNMFIGINHRSDRYIGR